MGRGVDALALTVCDVSSSRALAVLDAERKPCVLLYNPPDRPDRLVASVDNVAAARALTAAIVAHGHRRIAFLAGRFSSSDRSRLRYCGYAEALADAGLACAQPIEVGFADETLESALAPLFDDGVPPTALVCSNDLLALAAIAALRRLGRSVPGDLSVVGFDGIALGRMIEPKLATIAQPARAMGETAMRMILDHLAGRRPAGTTLLPFELRLGGTLAAAPGTSNPRERSLNVAIDRTHSS